MQLARLAAMTTALAAVALTVTACGGSSGDSDNAGAAASAIAAAASAAAAAASSISAAASVVDPTTVPVLPTTSASPTTASSDTAAPTASASTTDGSPSFINGGAALADAGVLVEVLQAVNPAIGTSKDDLIAKAKALCAQVKADESESSLESAAAKGFTNGSWVPSESEAQAIVGTVKAYGGC